MGRANGSPAAHVITRCVFVAVFHVLAQKYNHDWTACPGAPAMSLCRLSDTQQRACRRVTQVGGLGPVLSWCHPAASVCAGAHPGERARRRCLLVYRYGAKVCPDMQTVSPRSAAEVAGWGASTHCCSQRRRGQARPAAARQHPTAHLRWPTLRVPRRPPRPPLADSLVLTAAVLWAVPCSAAPAHVGSPVT